MAQASPPPGIGIPWAESARLRWSPGAILCPPIAASHSLASHMIAGFLVLSSFQLPHGNPEAAGTLSRVFLTTPPSTPWLQSSTLTSPSCCPRLKSPFLSAAFRDLQSSETRPAEHLARGRHSTNMHVLLLPSETHRRGVGGVGIFTRDTGHDYLVHCCMPSTQHWAWRSGTVCWLRD